MRKLLLLLCFLSQPAHATVVNPSGHDDTAAIQAVCNAGNVVELVKGVYHVSSVTCKNIVGKNPAGGYYFWYEGVQPFTTVVGTSTAGAPAIVCPSSGCAYANFAINPAQSGAAGIGTAGTVHGITLDGMLIADNAGGQSGSCVDLSAGQDNQLLMISNSTLIHCGAAGTSAWCVNAGVASDSSITGYTIISNCGAGGVLITYGFGWDIRPFRIEAQYNGVGVAWLSGGNGSIDTQFDLNIYDIQLGDVYVTLGKVMDSRLAPGGVATFNITGNAALAGGTVFTAGPTFRIDPSVPSFYACGNQIVGLSAADAYSQQIVGVSVHASCQ